mmetsp:Transcript_52776/g.132762  ORF Transcript_52776/g.132762 Transcript_52776/m.132762 type:complete len:160 (-) Transcript_52776:16-495(-)
MEDNISQLQEVLDQQCKEFYTSVGVLQRDAPPALHLSHASPTSSVATGLSAQITASNAEAVRNFEEQARELARGIVRGAKTMDQLIDSLPGADQSMDDQLHLLDELEQENCVLGTRLNVTVCETETLLGEVRKALQGVYEDALREPGTEQSSRVSHQPQ